MLRISTMLTGSAATGEGISSRAAALLAAEAQGIAIDFTDMSMIVKDTGTPANAFTGDPNSKLTYASPSTKWIRNSAGILVSGTTLRTEYDASGNALGILNEPNQSTNLALYSDDLTNAAWVMSNMTAAMTATGVDGAANSATTITATAGNATALQAITSASASRITSCYIKRRTGSGTVNMTQDNGTTWAAVTVTSSWTRVSIAAATLANPTVGLRLVTSGDAVDVQFFQHEVTSSAVLAITSPIRTTSATVTRAADNISLALASFPYVAATPQMIYVKFTLRSSPTVAGQIIDFGGFAANGKARGIYISAGGNVQCFDTDGYVLVYNGAQTGVLSIGTTTRVATRHKANDFRSAKDGALGSADTTGVLSTVTSGLTFGTLVSVSGGKSHCHIQEVVYLNREVLDAELQSRTAA